VDFHHSKAVKIPDFSNIAALAGETKPQKVLPIGFTLSEMPSLRNKLYQDVNISLHL
jgi:hypothetical protein